MGKIKYFYKGVPLIVYCEKNNISYITIKERIRRLRKNYSKKDIDMDKIIQDAFNMENLEKYTIEGVSLYKYCLSQKTHLSTVKHRIKLLEKMEEYHDCSMDELVKMAADKNFSLQLKYMYNGIPLRQYCKENNISYTRIYERIYLLKHNKNYCNYPIEKLIEMSLNMKSKNTVFYHGVELSKYCKENELDYLKIEKRMHQLKTGNSKYSNLSYQEIARIIIEGKDNLSKYKYTYCNVSLKEYCNQNKLDYFSVVDKIIALKNIEEYKNHYTEEIIKIVIETHPIILQFMIDKKVQDYLLKNDIGKEEIINIIQELISDEEYKYKQGIKYIRDAIKLYHYNLATDGIFQRIKQRNLSQEEIKEICKHLGLDEKTIVSLSKIMKPELAIFVTNYFGEYKDNKKVITYKEIQRVDKLINQKLEDIELADLIKLYKASLIDTRERILEIKSNEARSFIEDYMIENNCFFDDFTIEDMISEYRYVIVKILSEDNYSSACKLMKKIDEKRCISEMIKIELEYRQTVILADIDGFVKDEETEMFSDKVSKLLECLSDDERIFIVHKYKNNYSLEDLSKIYKVHIDKVQKYENRILNKLKQLGNLGKINIR